MAVRFKQKLMQELVSIISNSLHFKGINIINKDIILLAFNDNTNNWNNLPEIM